VPDQEKRDPELESNKDVVSFYDSAAQEYDTWFEGEGKLIFENEVRDLEQFLPSLPRP
jgi:hypothetical protein